MVSLKYETCKNGLYESGYLELKDEEYADILNEKQGEMIMSVPTYERKTSSMEFISKARELLGFSVSMCTKMSKKYTFYGAVHTYDLAQQILDTLIKANSLDLETYYKKRTEMLDDALGLLNCLSNHLQLIMSYIKFKDSKGNTINGDKYWLKWGTLINICEKLIKGVKASDKKRMGV